MMKRLFVASLVFFGSSSSAFFDFTFFDQEFDRMTREMERATQRMGNVFATAPKIVPESQIEQVALSVDEQDGHVVLRAAVGKHFSSDQLSAEIKRGLLVINLANELFSGQIEISAQRASFYMSAYKKTAGEKVEGKISSLAESSFYTSQMISLPSEVDLSREPILAFKDGILTITLLKNSSRKLHIQTSSESTQGLAPEANTTTKVEPHDEFDNALK
jgi:hypothetical protein